MMIKKTALLILAFCSASILWGQSATAILKGHFKAMQKEQSSFLSKSQMATLYADKEVIDVLEKYLKDEKEKMQGEV